MMAGQSTPDLIQALRVPGRIGRNASWARRARDANSEGELRNACSASFSAGFEWFSE